MQPEVWSRSLKVLFQYKQLQLSTPIPGNGVQLRDLYVNIKYCENTKFILDVKAASLVRKKIKTFQYKMSC